MARETMTIEIRENKNGYYFYNIFHYYSSLVFHTRRAHRFDDVALRDDEHRYRNYHHYDHRRGTCAGADDTGRQDLAYGVVESL